ncbi:cell wall hydrolase [Hyphomonas sp.]|uniref:cell wall hydrolase n=1 Tax=Hyphomonas sp. TaxID=87 RepID=UPI0025B96558|nr:cell wall hydrolase [Hyphomonas sp.]
MTDQEQREVFIRGGMIAVCAVTATVSLPVISHQQTGLRAEAEYRAEAERFAMYQDAGLAVRTGEHTPALLDTPWLRTVEYTLKRDTDSSMSRYAMRDRDGAALATLASFRTDQIQRAETIDSELMCMAQAVYYESAREPLEGQMAVAEVIANRMKDHRYPDTACGVVFQGATRTTGCQFTFTCDGAMKTKPKGENWERAKRIAAHVLMGLNEERTGGATHYHATYVDPLWNSGLIQTNKVGLHIFYRFPRGAEWASVERTFEARKQAAAVQLAALDASTSGVDAADETLLFADAGTAGDDGYYAITPTTAPAGVTTSTRTISPATPRLMSIQTVPAEKTEVPAESVAAYTARQISAVEQVDTSL